MTKRGPGKSGTMGKPGKGTPEGPGHGLVTLARPEPALAVLTMSRPEARNSLSLALMAALLGAIRELASDASCAAIVLAAEGPAFCAGHDLKELTAHRADADAGRSFFTETMSRCSELMQAIVACPKPVIAAVCATATAAGCQLVATCDLAVASTEAKFCTPGVNIGLFCSTPMVALSRNVSRKQAMEMLLLGEMVSAEDAVRYGLVNRAVAPDKVMDEALAMARQIASKSAAIVAVGKQAFYRQIELPLNEAYEHAADVMVRNMMMADAEEGICAFMAKRPPDWKGR